MQTRFLMCVYSVLQERDTFGTGVLSYKKEILSVRSQYHDNAEISDCVALDNVTWAPFLERVPKGHTWAPVTVRIAKSYPCFGIFHLTPVDGSGAVTSECDMHPGRNGEKFNAGPQWVMSICTLLFPSDSVQPEV
ncbi:hypothetical protein KIPB_008987 [Kipferlia bialata]|uniref:Uncharacterized protein n=1 Tax=Kipferlia bialata TaxID=797122 RepID=A0A9K3GL62_9EUKA|nr:hypothetical protein KIPB_008987 [Kipferlia bialata]|eukprot:g8987.t1